MEKTPSSQNIITIYDKIRGQRFDGTGIEKVLNSFIGSGTYTYDPIDDSSNPPFNTKNNTFVFLGTIGTRLKLGYDSTLGKCFIDLYPDRIIRTSDATLTYYYDLSEPTIVIVTTGLDGMCNIYINGSLMFSQRMLGSPKVLDNSMQLIMEDVDISSLGYFDKALNENEIYDLISSLVAEYNLDNITYPIPLNPPDPYKRTTLVGTYAATTAKPTVTIADTDAHFAMNDIVSIDWGDGSNTIERTHTYNVTSNTTFDISIIWSDIFTMPDSFLNLLEMTNFTLTMPTCTTIENNTLTNMRFNEAVIDIPNLERIGNTAVTLYTSTTYASLRFTSQKITSIGSQFLYNATTSGTAKVYLLSATPPTLTTTDINSRIKNLYVINVAAQTLYKAATNWSTLTTKIVVM
jgi:hypothetical protein